MTKAKKTAAAAVEQTVPISVTDDGVLGPFGSKECQISVTLSPISILLKSRMEFDIRRESPVSVDFRQIRTSIINAARDSDLIVEEDKAGAVDLLERYYAAIDERNETRQTSKGKKASQQGVPADTLKLSDKEVQKAERLIMDIQHSDEDIRHMTAHFTHHLNVQGLVATAYAVTKVEENKGDTTTAWDLSREDGRISDADLERLANQLSDAEFQLLTVAAFNCVFIKATTVKNSGGR